MAATVVAADSTIDRPVGPAVVIPQYSSFEIVAIWAAATVPMGVFAWGVAPILAERLSGPATVPMFKALILLLTAGLIWLFVLTLLLVYFEQKSLRWTVVRDALWLHSPRSPKTGRVGGRLWLIVIPLIVGYGAVPALSPEFPTPANRDLGLFLGSDAGQNFFSGNWTWFGVLVVLWIFNSVLGEEFLFRGFLLPRMNKAFGRWDWVANGFIFALYHVHIPWVMFETFIADAFLTAYPTKRYRSTWIGVAVHSGQSVVFAVLVLMLVLR